MGMEVRGEGRVGRFDWGWSLGVGRSKKKAWAEEGLTRKAWALEGIIGKSWAAAVLLSPGAAD